MDSYNYKTELLKQEISFACNQSQLPAFVVEGVLHQILNEVVSVKMREMAVEAERERRAEAESSEENEENEDKEDKNGKEL